ncbi:uncharacterized protein K444DRAFT_527327, partial [Hyaloscypha bicolor E]
IQINLELEKLIIFYIRYRAYKYKVILLVALFELSILLKYINNIFFNYLNIFYIAYLNNILIYSNNSLEYKNYI